MRPKIHLAIALIYFFLNIVGLPFGLTYMALLAPFFYVWILLRRKTEILLPFLVFLIPFVIAHYGFVGVSVKEYMITVLNMTAIYVFAQAVYTWLKLDNDKERIFRIILFVNIFLCVVALLFYFLPQRDIFWIQQNLTKSITNFWRLKMFTYEASYYALVFTPVFLFFLVQYILCLNSISSGRLLLMLFIPFVLSFSTGVISCLLGAGFLTFVFHFRSLVRKRRIVNAYITGGVVLFVSIAMLFFFFRDNVLFIRLQNIIDGKDTSAMGRTTNAFELAKRILDDGNALWGIGPGQLKLRGDDIIKSYYLYVDPAPVAIPNAAAETLALFGWIGFSLRIGIEFLFFFITKPWKNYYRLILFFFIFLYQFTGSYITNPAEYVLWVFAFTPAFPAFNVVRRIPGGHLQPDDLSRSTERISFS